MKITYIFKIVIVTSELTAIYDTRSLTATTLLESNSANYQRVLYRFMDRVINCKIHKFMRPGTLGTICQDVLYDYRVLFHDNFTALQKHCQTPSDIVVPCFPNYYTHFVIHSVAAGTESKLPLYYFYVTSI